MAGEEQRKTSRQSLIGGWLSGPPSVREDLGYPGERLGLPENGPGSAAGYGWRILALFIDWAVAMLIVAALAPSFGWDLQERNWATLGVFGLQVWVLTGLLGLTIGKRICRLRVVRLDGRPVGPLWALARTALLLAVVPAIFWDRDFRGLHDRAANTIVLRT